MRQKHGSSGTRVCVCPTLLHARPCGMWISSRGRSTNVNEMLRLQGFSPTKFKIAVSPIQLGQQLGNAMSVCTVERLLVRLLPAAQLTPPLVDEWDTGVRFQELAGTVPSYDEAFPQDAQMMPRHTRIDEAFPEGSPRKLQR